MSFNIRRSTAIAAFGFAVGFGGTGFFLGTGKYERAGTALAVGVAALFGASSRRRSEIISKQAGIISEQGDKISNQDNILRRQRRDNAVLTREIWHVNRHNTALCEALSLARNTNDIYAATMGEQREQLTTNSHTIGALGEALRSQTSKVQEQEQDLRQIVGDMEDAEDGEEQEGTWLPINKKNPAFDIS